MKMRELFDENFAPKWNIIWELEPFKKCIGVQQNTDWHKETLEEHIRRVTEKMYECVCGKHPEICHYAMTDERKLRLMAAALCHDLGKPLTTRWDEGLKQWKCKNHGAVGEKITRSLFFDDTDILTRESVCWMVRYHMTLHHVDRNDEGDIYKKISLLANTYPCISFEDMVLLYYCDCFGTDVPNDETHGYISDYVTDAKYSLMYGEIIEKQMDESIRKATLPEAIVMVGVAGSGKSTIADELSRKNEYVVISRDNIREELGMTGSDKKFKGSKQQEEKVTQVFMERLLQCAKNGQSFVIDNTNLLERYRKNYKELLKDYDYNWICIYVEAPTLDECKKRRLGQMPCSEIDRMMERLEFPRHYEFDSIKLVKQIIDG